MEYRSPKYNADGTINAEINHPNHGWIPFTADPNDAVQMGRDLFADLQAIAAPYVDPGPQPETVPQVVSRFQARAALHLAGILSAAETAIQNADELSKIAWADAQEFRRSSPLVAAVALELGLTESDLDDLFRQAAGIEA